MKDKYNIALPSCAAAAVDTLESAGYEAYAVGGCVRDSLRGATPSDWDICTSATPDETMACFCGRKVIATALKHGTVTVIIEGRPMEITTFRADGVYSDNRRPDSVRFVRRLDEDLSRRDFTVNAMAYNRRAGLIDLYGGVNDLKKGVIRCVGDAEKRFDEDGLRILRALRFASRCGFEIEASTAGAIREKKELLRSVSTERVLSELKGLLTGEGVEAILTGFPDVLAVVLPETDILIKKGVWTEVSGAVGASPPDFALRFALLMRKYGDSAARSGEIVSERLKSLKSDGETLKKASALASELNIKPPCGRAEVAHTASVLGTELCRLLFEGWKAEYSASGKDPSGVAEAERTLETLIREGSCLSLKTLAINGNDLLGVGVPAGAEIGRTLNGLLDEVLSGTLPNEREALLDAVTRSAAKKTI